MSWLWLIEVGAPTHPLHAQGANRDCSASWSRLFSGVLPFIEACKRCTSRYITYSTGNHLNTMVAPTLKILRVVG